jgi:integrase
VRDRSHNRRWLELNHGTYRVVVGRRVNGKVVKLQQSLGTSSLREAMRLRWPVVAELQARLSGKAPAHPIDDPEAWKAALDAGDGGPDDQTPSVLSDHLERLEAKHGTAYAKEFADRAYGRATPLDAHLPAFLASRGELKEDTRERHEAAVKALADWLKRNHLPPTLQAVTRKVAIAYVDQLPAGGRDPKRLSLQWQWLLRRETVEGNPWRDLSTAPRRPLEPERAFTDDEAKRLLEGSPEPAMGLLMRVLALTGARLDAVINMRVEGDTIILPPQKKERGPRAIPLHSHLREPLIGFQGWPWHAVSASQRFTRYRRSVLGQDPPGRTRAIVNAHSWRRWFISQAERAGVDERVISDVVGHARRSMTGRYSAGASMGQMRACVEAVKLPQ